MRLLQNLCCALLVVGCGAPTAEGVTTQAGLLAEDGASWSQARASDAVTYLGQGIGAPVARTSSGELWEIQDTSLLEYGAPPGASEVLSTLVLPDRSLFISTRDQLLVYRDGAFSASPLSGQFGTLMPTSMARRGPSLWMANTLGVYHHEAGTLTRAREGLGAGPYLLSAGPTPASAATDEVIWVGSSRGVFALERDAEGFARYPSLEGRPVQALHTSRGQHLWAISEGDLLVRTPDSGTWNKLTLSEDAIWVGAHPASADIWIRTMSAQTYHYAQGSLTRVQGDPWSEVAWVDAQGRLLVGGPTGVEVHERRYAVRMDSPPRVLDATTTLSITHSFPDALRSLTASVSEGDLKVSQGQITLDPAVLGPGTHEVEIQATWEGGQAARARATVLVTSQVDFTWEEHIAPLFEERCAKCHGVRASRELYLREQWEADFENLYEQVERGLMPLPPFAPLDTFELGMLRSWRDAGFRP